MGTNANAPRSIRSARLACGLTQQALAAHALCSISMVRIAERGYGEPASPVIARMLDVLDDRLANLHRGEADRPDGAGPVVTPGPHPDLGDWNAHRDAA